MLGTCADCEEQKELVYECDNCGDALCQECIDGLEVPIYCAACEDLGEDDEDDEDIEIEDEGDDEEEEGEDDEEDDLL